MKQELVTGSLIAKAHERIAGVVVCEAGDTVVDATLGNGHDTLFLAKAVGQRGKVIGFDIQEDALVATAQRLKSEGIGEDRYELHLKSHAEIARHVPVAVKAVMFNLGYLPGGDKAKITQMESTLIALSDAIDLLAPGGLMTVMCYPGHPGGDREAEAVRGFLNSQIALSSAEEWDVTLYQRQGASDTTPFLFVINRSG